jgi:hypothetical protein
VSVEGVGGVSITDPMEGEDDFGVGGLTGLDKLPPETNVEGGG